MLSRKATQFPPINPTEILVKERFLICITHVSSTGQLLATEGGIQGTVDDFLLSFLSVFFLSPKLPASDVT